MQELQLDDECETMIRADGSWDFGENETPAPGVKIDLLRHNFSMTQKNGPCETFNSSQHFTSSSMSTFNGKLLSTKTLRLQ